MFLLGEALNGRSGHEVGRQLLAQLYHQTTGETLPTIAVTENGKPYFPDSPWHFSISHTEHYAFCALSRQNIGLDAEEKGRKVSTAMVEKFLSPTEKSRIGDDPQDAFLRLWVLKEAFAKLTGKGIGNWMKNTDFDPQDTRIQEINGCYVAVLEDTMLFDTHVHLNDPCFDADREELMAALPQKGIGLAMNAGCSLETSKQALEMAAPYDWLYCSVGSHPDSCDEVNDDVIEEYRKLCKLNPKVKAIGEIGLDYHYEDIPREIQKKAFIAQMELARELDMPVIVHEREAHDDGMNIIRQFPTVKGVFHCYSGSAEMARQLTKLGWYIGFTGVLTFKNARKAVETAQAIPLEQIVIETDCPFMAPEPFRGKRNDPSLVYRVAEKLAELRGITPEEARRITFENGKRLYRID